MFQKNEYVVHGLKGVCRIKEISPLDFVDNKELYYILVPMSDAKAVVYVPVNSEKAKLRRLMDAEEAKQWLRELPEKNAVWHDDERRRKQALEDVMISGDQEQWSVMVNGICQKMQQKISSGKAFTDREREMYRSIKRILLGEMVQVFGCSTEDMEEQILSQIKEDASLVKWQ